MPAHVAYTTAMDGPAPVIGAKPRFAADVADGAVTAEAVRDGDIVIVTAKTNIYVAFGPTGTVASASNGYYLPEFTSYHFGRTGAGDVVSVTAAD